jgi:ornithine cyclodeaminase/alanine dehydrogenase-like protein (mu-crystallin family)
VTFFKSVGIASQDVAAGAAALAAAERLGIGVVLG